MIRCAYLKNWIKEALLVKLVDFNKNLANIQHFRDGQIKSVCEYIIILNQNV